MGGYWDRCQNSGRQLDVSICSYIPCPKKKIMSGDDKDAHTLCLYTCKILAELGYICAFARSVGFRRKGKINYTYLTFLTEFCLRFVAISRNRPHNVRVSYAVGVYVH